MDRAGLLASLHDEATALLAAARGADPLGGRAGVPGVDDDRSRLAHRRGPRLLGLDRSRAGPHPENYVDPQRPGAGQPARRSVRRRRHVRQRARRRAVPRARRHRPGDTGVVVDAAARRRLGRPGGWPTRRRCTASTPSTPPAASIASRRSWRRTASTSSSSSSCPAAVDSSTPLAGSVHLHCTDADGEWTVRPEADGATRSLAITPRPTPRCAATPTTC